VSRLTRADPCVAEVAAQNVEVIGLVEDVGGEVGHRSDPRIGRRRYRRADNKSVAREITIVIEPEMIGTGIPSPGRVALQSTATMRAIPSGHTHIAYHAQGSLWRRAVTEMARLRIPNKVM